jgi:hypothetical protein
MKVNPVVVLYHIIVHAFFKSLLFLLAGSLIHSSKNHQNIFKITYFSSSSSLNNNNFYCDLNFKLLTLPNIGKVKAGKIVVGDYYDYFEYRYNNNEFYRIVYNNNILESRSLFVSFLLGVFVMNFALSKELIIIGLVNLISSNFLL